MAKHNPSTEGYTESMIVHKSILEKIVEQNEGFEYYRMCGGRNKYHCLEYQGKAVLVLEGKASKGCGQLGTKCSDGRIIGDALEVSLRNAPDPEPDTLYTRYRYRSGWFMPYTIMFKSYDDILPEIERVLGIMGII